MTGGPERHLGPADSEHEIVAPAPARFVNEKELTSYVRDQAKLFGWRRYHTFWSKHSAKGFPVEVLVRGRRLIFAELKSEKGKVSDEQQAWLGDLRWSATAIEIYIWRPSDIDEIAQVLR